MFRLKEQKLTERPPCLPQRLALCTSARRQERDEGAPVISRVGDLTHAELTQNEWVQLGGNAISQPLHRHLDLVRLNLFGASKQRQLVAGKAAALAKKWDVHLRLLSERVNIEVARRRLTHSEHDATGWCHSRSRSSSNRHTRQSSRRTRPRSRCDDQKMRTRNGRPRVPSKAAGRLSLNSRQVHYSRSRGLRGHHVGQHGRP
mmetsp:Transcript_25262/g.81715  ORF Transcript_25262/g.81715 Transcript_25262/m.81715 type:complete len:203 (-) Transcript_25262:285-893(-)